MMNDELIKQLVAAFENIAAELKRTNDLYEKRHWVSSAKEKDDGSN